MSFNFYRSKYGTEPAFVVSVLIKVPFVNDPKPYDIAILAKNESDAVKLFGVWKQTGENRGYFVEVVNLRQTALIPGNWKIIGDDAKKEETKQSEQTKQEVFNYANTTRKN